MRTATSGLLLIWALLMFPAESSAQNAALRSACMGDAKRLCGTVLRDPQARRACMQANRSKLSAGCQAALGKRRNQAIASCKKRLASKIQGLGRDKAREIIRSCVVAEIQRR
jgi:hypothetical protein